MLTGRHDNPRSACLQELHRGNCLLGCEAVGHALDEIRDGLAARTTVGPGAGRRGLEDPPEQRIACRPASQRGNRPPRPARRQRDANKAALAHQGALDNGSQPGGEVEHTWTLQYAEDQSLRRRQAHRGHDARAHVQDLTRQRNLRWTHRGAGAAAHA